MIVLLTIRIISPNPTIEEGHNYFMTHHTSDEVLKQTLPSKVFSVFEKKYKDFLNHQKTQSAHPEIPVETYAFSSDSLWTGARYSRVVNKINFTNLVQFRGGFANQLVPTGTRILKKKIPYFVMYQFPKEYEGSVLTWKGLVVWPLKNGYKEIEHHTLEKKRITVNEIGKPIFAFSATTDNAKSDLQMKLSLNAYMKFLQIIHGFLLLLTMMVILFAFLNLRDIMKIKFLIYGISIGVFLLLRFGTLMPTPFFGYHSFDASSSDQLIYEGYGKIIAKNIFSGNLKEAIRGGQDIFEYTPGYRYFRAFEKILFGDTFLGIFTLILFAPILFYKMLRLCLIPRFFSIGLMGVFCCVSFPIKSHLYNFEPLKQVLMNNLLSINIENINFIKQLFFQYIYYHYWSIENVLRSSLLGYNDGCGTISFIIAFYMLLKSNDKRKSSHASDFFYGLLLAFSVIIRPNLAPGMFVVVLAMLFVKITNKNNKRSKNLISTLPLAISSLLVFFPLIHNLYYGKEIHLFVISNLEVGRHRLVLSPMDYWNAFLNLVQGDFQNDNKSSVIIRQIKELLLYFSPLHMLSFFSLIIVLFIKRIPSFIKVIAVVSLSLNLPVTLFHFPINIRYLSSANLLRNFVFFYCIKECLFFNQSIKNYYYQFENFLANFEKQCDAKIKTNK